MLLETIIFVVSCKIGMTYLINKTRVNAGNEKGTLFHLNSVPN